MLELQATKELGYSEVVGGIFYSLFVFLSFLMRNRNPAWTKPSLRLVLFQWHSLNLIPPLILQPGFGTGESSETSLQLFIVGLGRQFSLLVRRNYCLIFQAHLNATWLVLDDSHRSPTESDRCFDFCRQPLTSQSSFEKRCKNTWATSWSMSTTCSRMQDLQIFWGRQLTFQSKAPCG